MKESRLIPHISFKGVFIFIFILFIGMLIIPIPLRYFHLSESLSYFISAGVSAFIGMSIELTKVDGKSEDKVLFKKRILIALIIGFSTSALMTFVFGGDILE